MKKTWKIGTIAVALAMGGLLAAAAVAEEEGPGARIWEYFSQRFDADQDGRVTREEFDRATSRFPRMDQNGDGVLTEEDFEGLAEQSQEAREKRPAAMLLRLADTDRDHEVTSGEWGAYLETLDSDLDGVISVEELRASAPERPGRRGPHAGRPGPEGADPGERFAAAFDADGDGLVEVEEIAAIFSELDSDADGVISSEELPRFRGRFGPGPRGPRGGRFGHGRPGHGRLSGGFGAGG